MWIDIVAIVLSCVLANHLGLIEKLEHIMHIKLCVVNCVKCFTFWCVLAYGMFSYCFNNYLLCVAISFLMAYFALWLELFLCLLGKLYTKAYEMVYEQGDSTDKDIGCTTTWHRPTHRST